jgi:hypothetical protein
MPIKGLYLGGASAHPGGGVHGAAGANAARVLLQDLKWQSMEESISKLVVSASALFPRPRSL